jgi:hypothetical protein
MSVIDNYLSDLDARLLGPGRRKADLLAEARDGLTDAADAYSSAGLTDTEAERRAVAEFGDVTVVAREYQAELGVTVGVHALHMMMIAIPATQGLFNLSREIWFGDWSKLTTPTPRWYPVVANFNDAACIAAAVLGLVALVGTKLLGRRLHSARVARFAAVTLAVGVGAHFVALTTLLISTGVVDPHRLVLNLPCGAVAVLSVVVCVRLIVLVGRTWRSCATIVP